MKWQIPYAGETYEFDDVRLTASEARLQKRLTDGMTPVAAENARAQLDPDAWVAALAIARRRIGLDAEAAVDIDGDELDLMAAASATSGNGDEDKPKPRRRKAPEAPAVVDAEPAATS